MTEAAGQGRLVAVVVTHNRLEKLKFTVMRLLEAAGHVLHGVVVVDNASSDDTALWLSEQTDPRLEILSSAHNLGGAGGFEAGMALAQSRFNPDWIVIMDDDARPEPGALARFHETDTSGWDALLAGVFTPAGAICDMNRPLRNPLWRPRLLADLIRGRGRRVLHLEDAAFSPDAPVVTVDGGSFVGLFLSRRAFDLVGLPDRRLVYAEDVLHTVALTSAGGQIGFAPAIRFEHDCDTFTRAPRDFAQGWKVYYYYRNLLFLYRMTTGLLFWPGLLLLIPRWAIRGMQLTEGRGLYYGMLARALSDGVLRRLPEPPYGEFYRKTAGKAG